MNLPPPEGTLDLGADGLRDTLARYGIGYQGYASGTFFGNVLHLEHETGGMQQYNGQQSTGLSEGFADLSYDLSRYGVPDGQIVLAGTYAATSCNPLGPNLAHIGTISYYQTAFNKAIEFKIGLLANDFEFGSHYAGGNIAGGVFGPSASLFYQAGLSSLSEPTYGANVTIHFDTNIYDKVNVARAIDPDGTFHEVAINPTGLRGSVANSGVAVIDEVGYLQPAALDTTQMWLSAGGIYSSSRYTDYDDGGRTPGNYMGFFLGDRQLLQISSQKAQAYRELYAGVSVEYAPSNLNRYSQYYEIRLYGLGLLPHRPHDQASIIATDTFFSRILTEQTFGSDGLAHHDSKSITASYSANIIHGLYFNGGVEYVNNPTSVTYATNTGSALDLIAGFSLFF